MRVKSIVFADGADSGILVKMRRILFICLQHSGHYMYRHFNIQQFYILPTQCIYVFCVDLRTNSDLFPYTALTDWFFITEF